MASKIQIQVDEELTSSPSEWSPECKIYVCNQAKRTDLCGSGVLVYDPQADVEHTELSKYCIITSNKVIGNENFEEGHYKVEFSKNSRRKSFDLFRVKKTVWNIPSAGQVIIFIDPNCKELQHFLTGQCSILSTGLTIAERDPHQQSFCDVANQRYFVKSDPNGENGKHFLKADNHSANNAAKDLEKADGTVIFQEATEREKKAVGIFNVVHKTQMEIFPMWFKSKVTDILANQQPTSGANGTDDVDVDASASENDENNGTQQPGSINSPPVQAEQDDVHTRTGEEIDQHEETANQQPTSGANGTDDVDVDASASENDENNGTQQPGSINSPPVQVEQDDVHTRTGEEIDQREETVDGDPPQDPPNSTETSTGTQSYENLPVSEKDKSLLDDLAVSLDKTAHRVVKDWEHLANIPEINAPLHVRRRCRIRTKGSCTLLLFDVLRAEFAEKSLGNMIDALEEIERRDVQTIITDHCIRVYPNAAWRTMNFWEFDCNNRELVYQMAGLLDQKELVSRNWRNLGSSDQFRLTQLRLEEIEQSAQIGGQPTQILMEYLYTTIPELTIGTFYDKIKNFENKTRQDVLQKLDQFIHERQISRNEPMKKAIDLNGDLMRDICVLFNKQIPGVKDWRHLAKAFNVLEEVKKECEPGKPKSPTKTLFQWILAEKNPPLTVGQLCKALGGIRRNDLVKVVRDYFQQQ